MTALKFGSARATTRYIDRQGEQVSDDQQKREFLQNGAESNATVVCFDYWVCTDPDDIMYGKRLVRITDNGDGMNADILGERLRTLLEPGPEKDDTENRGIGGRVASLPLNPHGVRWASRVKQADGTYDENMVMIRKLNGVYDMRDYEITEEDGSTRYEPVISDLDPDLFTALDDPQWVPSENGDVSTGTVVTLSGSEGNDTWTFNTPDTGLELIQSLQSRFWTFPNSVDVKVWEESQLPDGTVTHTQRRTVKSAQQVFNMGMTKGQVHLPGNRVIVHWSLWDGGEAAPDTTRARFGWVAYLHKGELFSRTDTSTRYSRMTAFGVDLGPVQQRLILVVEFLDATQDKQYGVVQDDLRAGIKHLGNREINHAAIGDEFMDLMPDAIKEALVAATAGTKIVWTDDEFKRQLKAALGDDFLKSLDRIERMTNAVVKAEDTPAGSSGETPAVPGHRTGPPQPEPKETHEPGPPRPTDGKPTGTTGKSRRSGKTTVNKTQVLDSIPMPLWQSEDEFLSTNEAARAGMAVDKGAGLRLIVNRDHFIIDRLRKRWAKEIGPAHTDLLEVNLQLAVSYELISRNVDAFTIGKHVTTLNQQIVDEMLTPKSMTYGLMGLKDMDRFLDTRLRHLKKKRTKKA